MSDDSIKQQSLRLQSGEKAEMDGFDQVKEMFRFIGDVMTESSERATQKLNAKGKLENVAIFVDYDNVYWTLMNNFSHDPDHPEKLKNLFVKLWERYGQDNIRTFRAYADFQKIRTNMTSLQKKRIQLRHVYSNDKDGDGRKNSSDIELCIDAIESTYKDSNIGTYVFVTADSDMIPILSRLMYKGKRVELFYLSKAAPQHVDMTNYAHYSEDLLDFLSVEVKNYHVDDYILPALQFIHEWWIKFRDDQSRYLGTGWFKGELVKHLGIPEAKCSEVIEKLTVEEYTQQIKKPFKDGTMKVSLALTVKGEQFILGAKEVASGLEAE
jgi:uncharacterized LabA/DUF88 family protein